MGYAARASSPPSTPSHQWCLACWGTWFGGHGEEWAPHHGEGCDDGQAPQGQDPLRAEFFLARFLDQPASFIVEDFN